MEGGAAADGHELVQLNVAQLKAPLDSPLMQPFVDRLDEINALAEQSPGFRWRLQGEYGNATDIRIADDPLVLVNMTVWATIDDLFTFTYRSEHKTVFARRFEWAERLERPQQRPLVAGDRNHSNSRRWTSSPRPAPHERTRP